MIGNRVRVVDSGNEIQSMRRIEVLTYTSGQNFAGLQIGEFTLSHGRISPEFVALPGRGGDPICGLSRSWWYGAERDGQIRLVRLRKPGQTRGRVLLPVREAIAVVQRIGEASKKVA